MAARQEDNKKSSALALPAPFCSVLTPFLVPRFALVYRLLLGVVGIRASKPRERPRTNSTRREASGLLARETRIFSETSERHSTSKRGEETGACTGHVRGMYGACPR